VTNAMLRRRSRGVAQFSQHMLGKAIDFSIPGVPLDQLRAAGLRLQRGGVGYYPGSGFVHVDVGSIRHWPRMTHDQLARVFPNGKTVHVPSNGGPLKGYSAALAEVQRRGSNSSAADAGSTGRGRNVLAKLLGIGSDEEEESETTASRGRKGAEKAETATPAAQELPPLPRARPARANEALVAANTKSTPPAKAGEFTLASASSSPATTPADVIKSRGFWQDPRADVTLAPDTVPATSAPATREAVTATGERLAWVKGPEGQLAPPRPPKEIDLQGPTETTASLNAWTSNPSQNDRVPTDLALAYAAPTSPEAVVKPAAAPMGALKSTTPVNNVASPASPVNAASTASAGNATVATKKPAVNTPGAKIAQRGFDPWLRGVIMTPSIHHSIGVAAVGARDARTLRSLFEKPRNTVAMVFSNDPTLGLTSLQFKGSAIAFLPTLDVLPRTAGLN
jgi:hypothetical protein